MTRVRRFNARKDCLVCTVGVIAGGHYDQGRDLNAKLHDHYFIFNGFISKDCLWSAWLHIKTDLDCDDNHWWWWLHRMFLLMMMAVLIMMVMMMMCRISIDEVVMFYGLTKVFKIHLIIDYIMCWMYLKVILYHQFFTRIITIAMLTLCRQRSMGLVVIMIWQYCW